MSRKIWCFQCERFCWIRDVRTDLDSKKCLPWFVIAVNTSDNRTTDGFTSSRGTPQLMKIPKELLHVLDIHRIPGGLKMDFCEWAFSNKSYNCLWLSLSGFQFQTQKKILIGWIYFLSLFILMCLIFIGFDPFRFIVSGKTFWFLFLV